jgi:phosphatidylglycerol:prolipoprotein diacylglycerol transferase
MIEFVKENQVGFENGMTLNMGQLLSLPYIFAGIGFMIVGCHLTAQARQAGATAHTPVIDL